MILDIVRRSVKSRHVLLSVEELVAANAVGSRLPDIDPALLTRDIARRVVDACSTSALTLDDANHPMRLILDYGECIGCGSCIEAGAPAFHVAERLPCCGVSRRGLVRQWAVDNRIELLPDEPEISAAAKQIRAIVGRALNVRQVDGGSCNGCEAEIGALTNPYYDLERFGIHFVASPKHADMLLVTGPVTRNMEEAVKNTYLATPSPKVVIAVGACGCSGGIFAGSAAVAGAVDSVIPVDAFIPGCPPTPAMLLTGILQAFRHSGLPGCDGCTTNTSPQ